jgi:hypothetical protein
VYEFADADEDLEPGTGTIRPQDLEPDHDYHVVLSHVGGLYRYAVGDVVRVVDRVHGVPRLAYAGRSTRSDAAGERLREAHVVRALQDALAGSGLSLRNVACRVERPAGGPPRYRFAVAPETTWPDGACARFGALLDVALRGRSPGYALARRQGRLGGLAMRPLHPDSFQREWHARVAAGVRPTQVKDRLFRPEESQWRQLIAASDHRNGADR